MTSLPPSLTSLPPNLLLGSHDSAANQAGPAAGVIMLAWLWAKTQTLSLEKQYDRGARLFDLRYSYDDKQRKFIVSHTFPTSYTLQGALLELLASAASKSAPAVPKFRLKRTWSKDFADNLNTSAVGNTCAGVAADIVIRLKRDNAHPEPLPAGVSLQDALSGMSFNGKSFLDYVVLRADTPAANAAKASENKNARPVLIYSDNDTPIQDGLSPTYIHGQIFDTVETWQYPKLSDAVKAVKNPVFVNNGLPKVIFLDYSSWLPPIIASDLLYQQVSASVGQYIKDGLIQGLVVNNIGKYY